MLPVVEVCAVAPVTVGHYSQIPSGTTGDPEQRGFLSNGET